MGLRTRLFLFFGGLMAVLVSAELWLVRRLAGDLEQEVGNVALEVGSEVLRLFGTETAAPAARFGEPGANRLTRHRVRTEDGAREFEIGFLARVEQDGTGTGGERRIHVRPAPLAGSTGFGRRDGDGDEREARSWERIEEVRRTGPGDGGPSADSQPVRVIAIGSSSAGDGEVRASSGVGRAFERARVLQAERDRLVALRGAIREALAQSEELGEPSEELEARIAQLEEQTEAFQVLESELDLQDVEFWGPARGRVEVRVQNTFEEGGTSSGSFLAFTLDHESLLHLGQETFDPVHEILVDQFHVHPADGHSDPVWLDLEESFVVEDAQDVPPAPRPVGSTARPAPPAPAPQGHAGRAGPDLVGAHWEWPLGPGPDGGSDEGPDAGDAAAPSRSGSPFGPGTVPMAAGGSGTRAPAEERRVAGSQDLARVPIQNAGTVEAIERFLRRLLLGSAGILGMGLLVAAVAAHRVTHPLRDLARAARDVGEGALGEQVPPRGEGEVRETIAAFNSMSSRLAHLDREARELREREHLSELGEVARGVAHSLRNPLNALGLAVDTLAARAGDAHGELAEAARSQIRRVDRTLRTLLTLAGSGAGSAVGPVSVADEARDVALELMQDGSHGVRLTVRAAPDAPPVPGVAAELRAVVHVLMVNAVEASPPDGTVEVHVEPLAGEPGVTVRVLDRGHGIPPELRSRLFTPHTTSKEQGAGMGLYLARRIATSRHGGSLELRDRDGGGTEAHLVLRGRGEGERG